MLMNYGALAAQRMHASPEVPGDVFVEGLRRLAAAVSSEHRYRPESLHRLQRDLLLRIIADLKLKSRSGEHSRNLNRPYRPAAVDRGVWTHRQQPAAQFARP